MSGIKVAIIGAAGFSGLELMGILAHHPKVELVCVTSERYQGQRLRHAFPNCPDLPLCFESPEQALNKTTQYEAAFLAIPNEASLVIAAQLVAKGVRVIDLSGVFRLKNVDVFEQFYQLQHSATDLLETAVFGLPEAYGHILPQAQLVANPGCYPTGALLGLLPLGKLATQLAMSPVIDAKSGVSGAGGRSENDFTDFMQVHENFKAYKLFAHQHTPEIDAYFAELTPYSSAEHGGVIFTAHLLPVVRGILSTIYLRFNKPVSSDTMRECYQQFCQNAPFVTLLSADQSAELRMVQHTNQCVISLHHDTSQQNWIVLTAIDNLVKGAAGQAVQNLNLMYGFDETLALH